MSRDHGRAITRAAVTGAGASSVIDRFPTVASKRHRIQQLNAQIEFYCGKGNRCVVRDLRADVEVLEQLLSAQLEAEQGRLA
jgi:hypothetical protein